MHVANGAVERGHHAAVRATAVVADACTRQGRGGVARCAVGQRRRRRRLQGHVSRLPRDVQEQGRLRTGTGTPTGNGTGMGRVALDGVHSLVSV